MGKEDINVRLRAVLKYLENSSTQEVAASCLATSCEAFAGKFKSGGLHACMKLEKK